MTNVVIGMPKDIEKGAWIAKEKSNPPKLSRNEDLPVGIEDKVLDTKRILSDGSIAYYSYNVIELSFWEGSKKKTFSRTYDGIREGRSRADAVKGVIEGANEYIRLSNVQINQYRKYKVKLKPYYKEL